MREQPALSRLEHMFAIVLFEEMQLRIVDEWQLLT